MSTPVVEIACAKVNLALHVLGRRTDGFHELDSIVAFADVGDRLVVSEAKRTSLKVAGPFAKDVPTDDGNLILKAYALLSAVVNCPPVAFELEKNLPVASGIGGGSADAAAALRGLLRLMGRTIARSQMTDIALQLGADVPVCLGTSARRMRGIGEELSPLANPPKGGIVLFNPLVPCATAAVFKSLGLAPGQSYWTGVDLDEPKHWRNDLTDAAVAVVPEIALAIAALKSVAAFKAVRMSGSGATCFGLTDKLTEAQEAAYALKQRHPNWWVASASLL